MFSYVFNIQTPTPGWPLRPRLLPESLGALPGLVGEELGRRDLDEGHGAGRWARATAVMMMMMMMVVAIEGSMNQTISLRGSMLHGFKVVVLYRSPTDSLHKLIHTMTYLAKSEDD